MHLDAIPPHGPSRLPDVDDWPSQIATNDGAKAADRTPAITSEVDPSWPEPLPVSVAATPSPAPVTAAPVLEFPDAIPVSGADPASPPAVEAPAVQAPAVEAPGVEAPAVEALAVEAPAVEAPAVEAPAPVAAAPMVAGPVVEIDAAVGEPLSVVPAAPAPDATITLASTSVPSPTDPAVVEMVEMVEMAESATAEPGDKKAKASKVGWIAAVLVALVLVGFGAFVSLGALGAEGGSETPEAAVTQMIQALENEDLLTMATLVEPTERRTLVEPGFELLDELKRLGILAEDLDVASFPGIDMTVIEPPQLRTEQVTASLVRVYIEGGQMQAVVAPSRLPFGELLADAIPEGELASIETSTESMDSNGAPIALVQRDGRWYLSLWYTVAENARDELGQAYPSTGSPIIPVGSATPEEAVRSMSMALSDLDVERALASFDPLEAAALHEYAPLFMPRLNEEIARLQQDLLLVGVSWEITKLDFTSEVFGEDAFVTLKAAEGTLTGDGIDLSFAYAESSIRVEGTLEYEAAMIDVHIDDNGCLIANVSMSGVDEMSNSCDEDDDRYSMLQGMTVNPENFGKSAKIATRNVGGQWYVSPMGTMTSAGLDAVRGVERADIEAILNGNDVGEYVFFAAMMAAQLQNEAGFRSSQEFGSTPSVECCDLPGGGEGADASAPTEVWFGGIASTTSATVDANAKRSFVVFLQAGEQLTVEVVATDGAMDTFVSVFGPDGAVVAESDDGPVGTDSKVTLEIETGGNYVIEVSDYDYQPGTFDLVLTPLTGA